MVGGIRNGRPIAEYENVSELIAQVSKHDFDALALHTSITVDRETQMDYFKHGGLNPWGFVEAVVSRKIADGLNKPVAHAPKESITSEDIELYDFHREQVVDPRMAPEIISSCYLHCVLKGLHKGPRIGAGIAVSDVDFLVTPVDCVGRPHRACLDVGIPVIAVRENKTCLRDKMPSEFIIVDNYLEAVGAVAALKSGVHSEKMDSGYNYRMKGRSSLCLPIRRDDKIIDNEGVLIT